MAHRRHRLAARRKAVGFSQERLAEQVGVERSTIARWERGETRPQPWHRPNLARVLQVSLGQLDEFLVEADSDEAVLPRPLAHVLEVPRRDDRREPPELSDMNRRDVLRILSMVGTLVGTGPMENALDWERLDYAANRPGPVDAATLAEYAELNAHLWRVFVLSKSKTMTLPLVRQQLSVLTNSLQRSNSPAAHMRLCGLRGDLFQLAGEISFDNNQYTDAAQCYALAASASKEAGAYDLWACAMTRHAFIGVYERQFRQALPMLELAAGLAHKGDRTLSTRHWVDTVRAQALAGLGNLDGCQRALHLAEQVHDLGGQIHNRGWLRFDGSRLAEERGSCYVELQRADLAEAALTDALSQKLSTRRHGSVLADLAVICAQRQDVGQLVTHTTATLDMARQTGSGVLSRKLQNVQSRLPPLLSDRRVHHLDQEITALASASATR